MKLTKLFLSLFAVVVCVGIHGQGIVRMGDRYTVGEETYTNSTAFRGYLKNTNPELFAQYNKGYKTAMVGWGFFAVGMVAVPLGVMGMMANQDNPPGSHGTSEAEHEEYKRKHDMTTALFASEVAIGGGMAAAGVVMLGVGYHKMHRTVDAYGISKSNAPQTYWSVNITNAGLGLVCSF